MSTINFSASRNIAMSMYLVTANWQTERQNWLLNPFTYTCAHRVTREDYNGQAELPNQTINEWHFTEEPRCCTRSSNTHTGCVDQCQASSAVRSHRLNVGHHAEQTDGPRHRPYPNLLQKGSLRLTLTGSGYRATNFKLRQLSYGYTDILYMKLILLTCKNCSDWNWHRSSSDSSSDSSQH